MVWEVLPAKQSPAVLHSKGASKLTAEDTNHRLLHHMILT